MSLFASYASHARLSRGRFHQEPASTSGRSEYQRDRDRVIHSGAFRKLQYKTQVFLNHEGDYYRTRLTHSLEVAQVSRYICRILNIDEDLGEVLALAHDLGHTCFGHTGEDVLNECMAHVGGYDSNDQTLRILTLLEERYPRFDGLNLTWETIEGLAKHNGPLVGPHADRKKHPDGASETVQAIDSVWKLELERHAGLEAQVAALADDVAYTAHDIDDGLRSGYITLGQLHELPLVGPILHAIGKEFPGLAGKRQRHEMNRRLISLLVRDVLDETHMRLDGKKPQTPDDIRNAGLTFVRFSDKLMPDERVLRKFLYDNLYRNFRVNRVRLKTSRVVRDLYAVFMERPDTLPEHWQLRIGADMPEKQRARVVADYVAGMTDRFALETHKRLFDIGAV